MNKTDRDKLEKALNEMTDSELTDYILVMACKHLVKSEDTDVIEILEQCCSAIHFLKKEGNVSATRMFTIYGIIMDKLNEVADDGGIVNIDFAEGDINNE
jgi:RNA processing factor Prp31